MKKLLFPSLAWSIIVGLSSCISGSNQQQADYLLLVHEGDSFEFGTPCGYATPQGDTVIPLGKYFHCYTDTFRTQAVVLDQDGICKAIDRNEEEIYRVMWYDNGPDYLVDGLFRIIRDGKTGYANEQGDVVIEPQFACAFPFENGKAKVALNCTLTEDGEYTVMESDEWFYIDKTGNRTE